MPLLLSRTIDTFKQCVTNVLQRGSAENGRKGKCGMPKNGCENYCVIPAGIGQLIQFPPALLHFLFLWKAMYGYFDSGC